MSNGEPPAVNTTRQWAALVTAIVLAAGIPSGAVTAVVGASNRPQLTSDEVRDVRQIGQLGKQVGEIAATLRHIQQTQQEFAHADDLRKQALDTRLAAMTVDNDDRLRKAELDAWSTRLYILNAGAVIVPDVYTRQPIGPPARESER